MLTLRDALEPMTTSALNTTGSYLPQRPSLFHPKFYWGYKCEVLFSGWPDSSRAMYALALLFVFSLAVMFHWLTKCTDAPVKPGADKIATFALRTGMYAVRSGFSYLVVLSVVSFNGGIFLAAIFGHTLGFFIFRGRAIRMLGHVSG